MKTDVVSISYNGQNTQLAELQAKKIAEYKGLSEKDALHLFLLTEEMMGLMRSITGATNGKFWIEDEDGVYRLHLSVGAVVDKQAREQLLATASSGKNEATRTLSGKLREFFFRGGDDDAAAYRNPYFNEGRTGMGDASMPAQAWQWSLAQYRQALPPREEARQDAKADEAWDELERSVIAHVADDVKVSIRGYQTELILEKKLG